MGRLGYERYGAQGGDWGRASTGASAARLYSESIRQVNRVLAGPVTDQVQVPAGCSVFPKELQRPSRRWAERRFPDVRYWNEPVKGGHFAAFEQPELFVDRFARSSAWSGEEGSSRLGGLPICTI